MPARRGPARAAARKALNDAGFKIDERKENSDTVEKAT